MEKRKSFIAAILENLEQPVHTWSTRTKPAEAERHSCNRSNNTSRRRSAVQTKNTKNNVVARKNRKINSKSRRRNTFRRTTLPISSNSNSTNSILTPTRNIKLSDQNTLQTNEKMSCTYIAIRMYERLCKNSRLPSKVTLHNVGMYRETFCVGSVANIANNNQHRYLFSCCAWRNRDT
jgi:hypothetical protein